MNEENNVAQTGNRIIDLSFKFALDIVKFTDELEANRQYTIANQMLRSGTSIGANVRKHKVRKAKRILYINSKLQQKKQMKQNIGSYCANIQTNIHSTKHCFLILSKYKKLLIA